MPAAKFGVVGAGWRARYFLKMAGVLPEELEAVGVVVRRPEVAERVRNEWAVPTYSDVDELVSAARPDFVISCVIRAANPAVVSGLVERGIPVLSETPPAQDVDGLRALWSAVGASGLVQVAEQYLLLPGHAARLELVRRGTIGQPTSVQVSSTHGYHAVSMIRGLLGVGFGSATVTARTFASPLVDPPGRDAWTDDDTPKNATTTLATLDFHGRMGLYDFTDNQWHNQLRTRRLVVRGTHGELVDFDVTRLAGPRTIVTSAIARRQVGYDLDLDGYDTDHFSYEGTVLWRNDLFGRRLPDEEIAIATVMRRMAGWVRSEGSAPYPLAEACQDQLLSLAIDQAATTGRDVVTNREPWAG
jgi:predicted dehydrogenase